MRTANVHEAKSTLSKLLDAAQAGEEVFIVRNGQRYRLQALGSAADRSAMFGAMKDSISFAPDYEDADAQIAAMFDGSP